jgi:hypothetical protein
MNDELLIATVLREVAKAVEEADNWMTDPDAGLCRYCEILAGVLLNRAEVLDPPEKNEVPNE